MKFPWIKFFTADWLKDPALSLCSPATRGVWIDLLCAMHESGRVGELRGTNEQLARLARCQPAEMNAALTELQATAAADVTFRNSVWLVANRRMKKESEAAATNAKRQARFRENGGGDPDGMTAVRARVLARDGKRCAYCNGLALTVDHVTPKSKGGTDSPGNLVASCLSCNLKKGDRTLEEAGMQFHAAFDVKKSGRNGVVTPENLEVRGQKLETDKASEKASRVARLPVAKKLIAERFELALGDQWVNDAGKWVERVKANPGKCERVIAEVENAAKEGRIKTTPAQYAEQIWKEFK